jgi:WD40 repeat protein
LLLSSAKHLREELELRRKNGSVIRLRELEKQAVELKQRAEEADRRRRQTARKVRYALAAVAGLMMLTLLGVFGWTVRQRAQEEGRRRELREVHISRMRLRRAGWSSNSWSILKHAANIRLDDEVEQQASASLTGLDARILHFRENIAGASAAFGPGGQVLVGGVGATGLATLVDSDGAMTRLPARGDGPVCWTRSGAPLQFAVVSNHFALRDARTAALHREFAPSPALSQAPGSAAVLAATPDGSRVAAAFANRVQVWNAATGGSLGQLPMAVTSLSLSADGSLLGVGGSDGATRVYTVPGLAEVAVLPPALRNSPIRCLAFARDPIARYHGDRQTNSWLLATGDQGARIVIWDLNRHQPRSYCHGSSWVVTALAFDPDGLTLASSGRNEARLWDVASGRVLLCLQLTSSGETRALAFDGDGRRLVCGGEPGAGDATLVVWQLEADRGIRGLRGFTAAVRKVWFSKDGRRVAALSDDWQLGVWEVPSGRLVAMLETPVGSSYADSAGGCFERGGARFAFATWTNATVFNLETRAVLREWPLNEGSSDQLQFDGSGRLLLVRREREPVSSTWIWRLYELKTNGARQLLHQQVEKDWRAQDLAFAPNGDWFLVGSGRGATGPQRVHAYRVADGRELWKSDMRGDLRACFEPAGRFFACTADAPRALRLIRCTDFKELGKTVDDCEALSSSGTQYRTSPPLVRDPEQKDDIHLTTDWTTNAWVSAFSPDGSFLAWGTEEGVVLVADIQEVRRRLALLR